MKKTDEIKETIAVVVLWRSRKLNDCVFVEVVHKLEFVVGGAAGTEW